MGSISMQSRCQRFIEEFNDDIVKALQVPIDADIESCGLGIFDLWQQVFLYYHIMNPRSGRAYPLMDDVVVFDPDEDDDLALERVADILDVEIQDLIPRFEKADLLRKLPE